MRGELRRMSRPMVIFFASPCRRRCVPMARPRSTQNASSRSRSATPRMSYSRNTRGFMEDSPQGLWTLEVGVALAGFKRFYHTADLLGALPGHHQDGVVGD